MPAAAAERLVLRVRTLPLIAVTVVPALMPVPVMSMPTSKLLALASVRLFVLMAPAVEAETGRVSAVVVVPVPRLETLTVPPPWRPAKVYVLVPAAAPRLRVAPVATTILPVPKAPTAVALAVAPEAMEVPPEKRLAPFIVNAPPETVTVAVLVPVKRAPERTRVPAPDLVRPVVMLPELGLRVRTPLAAETSIVPVVTFSGRVEAPVAPVKRRVPAFSVMPVVVPRPRELPTVSAIVLASRTPSLTMVAPV